MLRYLDSKLNRINKLAPAPRVGYLSLLAQTIGFVVAQIRGCPQKQSIATLILQATHKLNGLNDFRISDLREFRFDLRQYRVETLKLGSSLLARLFRQLLRHFQYSSTSKFQ
jgi:hypothetical protein